MTDPVAFCFDDDLLTEEGEAFSGVNDGPFAVEQMRLVVSVALSRFVSSVAVLNGQCTTFACAPIRYEEISRPAWICAFEARTLAQTLGWLGALPAQQTQFRNASQTAFDRIKTLEPRGVAGDLSPAEVFFDDIFTQELISRATTDIGGYFFHANPSLSQSPEVIPCP